MVVPLRRVRRSRPPKTEGHRCGHCGELNRLDASFCRTCGAPILGSEPTEAPAAHGKDGRKSIRERLRWPPPGRRLIPGIVTAVVVLGLVAVTYAVVDRGEPARESLSFATVRRMDLASVRSLDGSVAATEGPRIAGRLSGTITQLAEEGSSVELGDILYSVDGQPVFLFYGSLPAWRDIGAGTVGADVRQLEEGLRELGFDVGDVDETFTDTTGRAVNAWLSSEGQPQVAGVRLGRVVFAPTALTVARQLTAVGASTAEGDEIMSTLSAEKVVLVSLAEPGALSAGAEVKLVLPGGRRVPGKVEKVKEPEAGEGEPGDKTALEATVIPDETGALDELNDGADVDVEVTEGSRSNVLVVPITALLARQDGGYVVEVDRRGRIELVSVKTGVFTTDLVEVTGKLRDGDRVVVP